ncbi:MAG: 4-(cytidine 5'-diphospho)-2-C-methyl-D-erythritol kinase [Ruminococcaceae bacterium]|nr:4-(cytidine 5'-diphospho)-2-C-methyl-D-erythritol kinase [Oscillospiraceae bacterium]
MTTKNAYAKINLTLEIREKREDGYHNIRSVMQKVTLCDSLNFEKNEDDKIVLTCNVDVCAPEDNLAYKAAVKYLDMYKKEQGKSFGVKIHIDKHIPDKAGLAGGSADCACVLDYLYETYGGIGYEKVEEIAASLGSDINFCLGKYICALCTDRGIVLEKCAPFDGKYILICVPDHGMKTSEIYRAFDDSPILYDGNPSEQVKNLLNNNKQENIYDFTVNSFAPICEKACPDITLIKDTMKKSGALASQMSGSGSSVYGIFENEDDLNLCFAELSEKFKKCYKCATVIE